MSIPSVDFAGGLRVAGKRGRHLLGSTALVGIAFLACSLTPSRSYAQIVTPQQANGTAISLDQPVNITTTATGASGYTLHALNGGVITETVQDIILQAQNSQAVIAETGGRITLDGTGGTLDIGATNLFSTAVVRASGANSVIDLTGATLSGTTTAAVAFYTARADTGGSILLRNSTVNATATATSSSNLGLVGVLVVGSTSRGELENVVINTNAALNGAGSIGISTEGGGTVTGDGITINVASPAGSGARIGVLGVGTASVVEIDNLTINGNGTNSLITGVAANSQGRVTVNGGTIGGNAITVGLQAGTGILTANDVNVSSTSTRSLNAVTASNAGSLTMNGGSISSSLATEATAASSTSANSLLNLNGTAVSLTTGSSSANGAIGIYARISGTANANNATVRVNSSSAFSRVSGIAAGDASSSGTVNFTNGSTLTVTGGTTSGGLASYGVIARGGGSTFTGSDSAISTFKVNPSATLGVNAVQVESGARGVLTNMDVTTLGNQSAGVVASGAGASVEIGEGSQVTTNGQAAYGLVVQNGAGMTVADSAVSAQGTNTNALLLQGASTTNTFALIDSTLTSQAAPALVVGSGTADVTLSGAGTNVTGNGTWLNVAAGATADLTLADAATVNGAVATSSGGTSSLTLADDALWNVSGSSSVTNLAFDGGILRYQELATVNGPSSITLLAGGGTIDTNGFDITLAHGFVGDGGFTKAGAGALILSADNGYVGETQVLAGTLYIDGDQSAATGLTSVAAGATLGGFGTIGGDVAIADGGTLAPGNSPGTLNINGDLSLSGGSILAYEFGQAGTIGGGLNDLIDVDGDLTVDGTLNVTVTPGGTFGTGIYRVINYAGTLTDNGLVVGTAPSPNLYVQTSVAGQVNLINTSGLTLNYWDGAAGPKADGVVNGGDGLWQSSSGNDNWTTSDGTINAPFSDGSFAIFTGTPGTVTVDDSQGAVESSGMQFAVDGYDVAGGPLTFVSPTAEIRVGDGTTAGANYTTAMSAALSGNSQVIKTDLGTLILSGANSYTGGTAIYGGVIAVSSDGNLGAASGGLSIGAGTLRATADLAMVRATTLEAGGGTFDVSAGTFRQGGTISGAGALVKSGAGTMILTADNTYSGGTTISNGVLQIGQGGTTGSITGDVVDNSAIVFARSDQVTFGGVISGSGSLSYAGTGTLVLTSDNTYTGGTTIASGTLQLGDGGLVGSIVGDVLNDGALVFDRSASATFDGVISGSGSVTQAGSGITELTGANSYLGATTVAAGTLKINGDQSEATGLTTVMNGAALGGVGVIGGDVVIADGGTLAPGNSPGTLIINGDLSLSGGSILAYDFGEAGVVGGPFNDLTNVGGDLVLDGTLNITVSPGGTFDPGVYRVINYSGALTDNGLAIGTIPAPSVFVQTSVAQEVNLINTAGLTLDFWDGAAGPKNDGVVNGGDGVWQSASGNDNWTDADGRLNAPYADGAFAIFEAAPGTVTVDESLGAINVAGMQFAGDGYVVTGDTIHLVGTAAAPGQALVRVGDGSASGADYSATIRSVLAGSSALTKDDLGTLILTGANSYSGATQVAGGTLLINGDQSAAIGLTSVEAGATLGGIGIIGGDVELADGATLAPGASPGTLTITGNLALSSGSLLNYEFGEAGVVGGALNDLVVVGGDLVLDGTLNVTASPGGTFAAGIYRVFDYSGALTDNGLILGSVPSADAFIQTSIAGQVNLVNVGGLVFRYWDGAAGVRNSGTIEGGNGVWQNSLGNDNWTLDDGTINGPFNDGAFAVFMGAPGTVTVDDGLGAVRASGMQFLVDGYEVDGTALTLTGPVSEIRVGDGTSAATGTNATIAAELAGAAQLRKTDLGTLILTGANSYTGGTVVSQGTLQLGAGGTSGSILGDVANNGALVFNRSDTAIFAGAITGSGSVTQAGSGTTVLSGANSYAGTTTVASGTLQAGAANSLSSASAHHVTAGGRLALDRFGQTIAALANAGSVTLSANDNSTPGTVLNVLGDYEGLGGTVVFNTVLEGDGSASDQLRVSGNTLGLSQVQVNNVGGGGAQTADGIKLIDVLGNSAGVFELIGDFTTTTGQQAVVAGAYAYTLNQGGKADPADGDWYLRSELSNGPGGPDPLFNPGTPLYENYAQTLLAMNALPTLRQRVGYRASGVDAAAQQDGGVTVWGRIDAGFGRSEAPASTTFSTRSDDRYAFNLGAEMSLSESADGSTLVGGLTAHYGTGRSDVTSIEGMGRIDNDAIGLGATLTWYGASGLYADAQANYTWYDSDLISHTAGKALIEGNNGHGYGLSLEGGWQSEIGGGLRLTPQVQLSYSNVSFAAFDDPFAAHVSGGKGESLRGRVGLALDRDTYDTDTKGRRTSSHLYLVPNLYYEFLDGAQATVSDAGGGNPVLFTNHDDRFWAGLGIGGTNSWNDGKIALFAEANLDTSLDNPIATYELNGRVGVRVKW